MLQNLFVIKVSLQSCSFALEAVTYEVEMIT